MFISYAQNFEDVMLWRALKHVEKGFYIDIGAQDPVSDSVSKAFYDAGWQGIHVEPTIAYAELLKVGRAGDFVLQAAVSSELDSVVIYEIEGTGLSTTSPDVARQHAENHQIVEPKQVSVISMDDLLAMAGNRDVHWLKIDTEGSEGSVIESWKNSSVRPWIIVVESIDAVSHEMNSHTWENELIEKGYKRVYFDGLNNFYISIEHEEIEEAFRFPPNVFDGFTLSGQASSSFSWEIQQKLTGMFAHLNSVEAERNVLTLALATVTTERAQLTTERDHATAERASLHHQVETQAAWWQARMAERDAQLTGVYNSTSWRVTAPMRSMARLLGRARALARHRRGGLRVVCSRLVHRAATFFRIRFPRVYFRLATNRLVRKAFKLFPRPPRALPVQSMGTWGGTSGPHDFDAGTLANAEGKQNLVLTNILSGTERWKFGKRIDA